MIVITYFLCLGGRRVKMLTSTTTLCVTFPLLATMYALVVVTRMVFESSFVATADVRIVETWIWFSVRQRKISERLK